MQRTSNRIPLDFMTAAALIICLATINAAAYRVLPAEIKLTDEDKKAILTIIFKRALGELSKEKEIVVLLAPGVNTNSIPEISGVRFRRLEYEEVKLVAEYYDFSFKPHRNSVDVQFQKGNACKMAGTIYEFRRTNGTWQSAVSGAVESTTIAGACPGCKVGSGAIYSVHAGSEIRPTNLPKSLILTGKVSGIRCKRNESKYIRCDVDLRLAFSNKSNEPIIILQPYEDYSFWYGGTSLALSPSDAEKSQHIYLSSAWPSIYTFPKYQKLAQRLDQPSPPPNVTRILQPQESWYWNSTAYLSFDEQNTCHNSIGVEIGWREVKNLTTSLWLKTSYEMWPFNVENFKPNLGGNLSKRWRKHGRLFLEEKASGYWFAQLTSEPIELNFREVQLQP